METIGIIGEYIGITKGLYRERRSFGDDTFVDDGTDYTLGSRA